MTTPDSKRGMLVHDYEPHRSPYDKEMIGTQLDVFANKHGLKSLRDRLRIGLNEVALLAFEKTNTQIKDMVASMAETPQEAEEIYDELVEMCVGMQEQGPWGYAKDLANPEDADVKAWFMIAGAETAGYERSMDLNDAEFVVDVKRIEKHLQEAAKNPSAFFEQARERLLKKSESAIRFNDDDKDKKVPMGEGFATFMPMAVQGYDAGVVQDAEGWVFVGARNEIEDSLIESTGLTKEVGPDDRDPSRTVTFFINQEGQKVIKKLHPGLLIILTKSFDLAVPIVKAVNDKKDAIEIAEEALGHTRVVQTTEKKLAALQDELAEVDSDFLRNPKDTKLPDEPSESKALIRLRESFYDQMLYARSLSVYLDALKLLTARRAKAGEEVTEQDKLDLSQKIHTKMEQKVDELRYVNSVIEGELDTLPEDVRSVIDMAGGAGDLGLAITNELLSVGREVDHTEIVDPQEGVADFMETMITYLPYREHHEKHTVHNTAFLQGAEITPDSMVVAKHACGTLTDDVIKQWRESESKVLVAMTCCQDKAKDNVALYGFSQEEWHRLCKESAMTNTEVPELPGKAKDRALRRLEKGNRAMKALDMARVEYLRRHGFKAELHVTDKFPKGDVIVARRLPDNFIQKLAELQEFEKTDPKAFDAMMMRYDVMAAGAKSAKGLDLSKYGENWTPDDFAELTRRFISRVFEEFNPVNADEEEKLAPDAGQENKDAKKKQKALLKNVFSDVGGRIDLYVNNRSKESGKPVEKQQIGQIAGAIRNMVLRADIENPQEIRAQVDAMMQEMGC
ncbi:MAG: methyltransferase [Patescibacteria group bacterium]